MDGRPWREEFTEPERYELRETPRHRFDLDRREFLEVLGAGILISTVAARVSLAQRAGGRGGGTSIEQRLHIGEDGVITVLTSKVEVGQGSRTQISMAAAEELRVPVEKVRLVMADSSLVPDDGGTAGSRTTPSTVPRVRRGCAAARELLVDTAARLWGVERASLRVIDGGITGPSPEQALSYGDLARRAPHNALKREVGDGVQVTEVSNWKVLGTPVPKVSSVDIVTGAHRYASDIVRPDMLHGAILRPPAFGATLSSADLAAAKAMDGVVAVRDGEFVGFAARTTHEARRASRAVARTAKWEETSQPSSETLFSYLRENATEGRSSRRGGGARNRGSVEEGFASAKDVLRESYQISYIQHAPMEPRSAVAEWGEGGLTVWTGTQQPSRVRGELASAFGLSADRVRVIVPDTGGGFGGKHTGEAAVEAARLARAAGRPVSLRWTREEEFTWAYFRPAGVIDIAAALDGEGRIVAWEHTNFNSGSSAIASPYAIPNTKTQFRYCRSPLRQGSYRALASTANVFARECVMDELAARRGVDPLEFRLAHLDDERLRAVLQRAADRFEWGRRRKEIGASKTRGLGLSCGIEKASYVAACAEVEVDAKAGRFRVVEVCEAFECGAIQNPRNLRAQVEGCIVQGLGAALTEEIRFERGRVLNPNFSGYEVPRFEHLPKLDIVLVNRPDLPSVGAGETPIVAVAPAVGNALRAATGVRIRSLPLRDGEFRAG